MANQAPQRRRRGTPESRRYQIFGVKLNQRDLILLGGCLVFICIAVIGCMASGHSEAPEEKPEEPPVVEDDKDPVQEPFQIIQDNVYLEPGTQVTLSTSGGGDTVTWTSADEKIATVIDGVVTGVAGGTTTITAAAGAESSACTVTVSGTPYVSSPELCLNHTDFTLRAEYPPEQMEVRIKGTKELYDGPVTWESANPQVVTVSETGLVERVGKGTTTVTATAGGQTLECIVRVKS